MHATNSVVSNSWAVVVVDYDGIHETHVLPMHDVYEHESSMECPCNPDLKYGAIVHNSFDNREAYERGERKLN